MEIEIDITRNDYAHFNKYYFLHKKLKRTLFLIFVSSLVFPFLVSEGSFNVSLYLRDAGFFAAFFILFYTIIILLTFKWIGRLPSKNGIILGKKIIRLTEEGLVEESENSTTLHKWKAIKSLESDKKYLFIFIDSIAAHIIPKRSFQNTAEEEAFTKEIASRLQNITTL